MAATRDLSQRFTFVYKNLHQVYKAGLQGVSKGEILKSEDISQKKASVVNYVAKSAQGGALAEINASLDKLEDLQAQVRFMIHEVDEMLKQFDFEELRRSST